MEKLQPYAVLLGGQNGKVTVENTMEVLQKIKVELAYDLVIPHLGIYPKEMKVESQRNIFTSMHTAASFTIAKIWKKFKCLSPVNR